MRRLLASGWLLWAQLCGWWGMWWLDRSGAAADRSLRLQREKALPSSPYASEPDDVEKVGWQIDEHGTRMVQVHRDGSRSVLSDEAASMLAPPPARTPDPEPDPEPLEGSVEARIRQARLGR